MDGLQTPSSILRAVARTILGNTNRREYKRSAKSLDCTHSVNRKPSHKLKELLHTDSGGSGLETEILSID